MSKQYKNPLEFYMNVIDEVEYTVYSKQLPKLIVLWIQTLDGVERVDIEDNPNYDSIQYHVVFKDNIDEFTFYKTVKRIEVRLGIPQTVKPQ